MRLVVQLALTLVVGALVLSPRVLVAQTAPGPQTETPVAQADQPDTGQPDTGQPDTSQPDTSDEDFFGQTHRQQIYEQSKLSTTRAVLYNLAVPGLGNVYAEQYFYGGIAFSLMVFTLVFVGYGLVTDQSQFLWFGVTTAGVAYTGSIATSILGVRDYNEKLRQGLKLEGAFAEGPFELPKARTIDLAIRF